MKREPLRVVGMTEAEALRLLALERRWEADLQRCFLHEAETAGRSGGDHQKRILREIELAEVLERHASEAEQAP